MAVIFWHWQHFFMTGSDSKVDRSIQPFYWLLQPVYDYGWIAVDIFFCLSGFVFFWLYQQSISDGRMAARRFAVLRLSRLYPLHIVTLVYMAVAQTLMWRSTGSFFSYPMNDVQHFVRNLFFIQAWGVNVPESFNGPSWSVSVEMLLYAVFFALARAGLTKRIWLVLGIAAAGAVCLFLLDRQIGRGILEFFLGGAVHRTWVHWAPRLSVKAATSLLWGLMAFLAVELLVLYFDGVHRFLQSAVPQTSILSKLDKLVDPAFLFFVRLIQIPLTIFAFAAHELRSGTHAYDKPAKLGDLTYASYMLHVPLQISLALAATWGLFPNYWLQSGAMLPIFFFLLIGLSVFVYRSFEIPAQRFLREKLGG